MRPTVIPLRSFDWVPLRTAFITRPERATYAELAAEFRVPEDRIKRASSDEGWAALRAAHLEEQLKQGDAAVAILRAAKMDSAVMGSFTNLALETVRKLQEIVDQVESKKSVNTRANTLNTVSFAMGNVARALKEVGVVGIPKALKESAGVDNGNGRWNPAMLQALNVTVQNIVSQEASKTPAKAVLARSEPAEEVEVARCGQGTR
ncbi:MAG: hypothetical protein RIR76_3173 [Verrucomicrobiota bacterium]|jgi:hypothetical protein